MACRITTRIRFDDGTEDEVNWDEAEELAESGEEEPEDWDEVSRETQEIEVDGVTIDRIVSVTFAKPSGKQIRLNFAESFE